MAGNDLRIQTVEMHTGGEPLRIVVSGMPAVRGKTVLEKIQYIRQNLDYIRKLLIFEPRGHFDMYGVILVEPDIDGADIGCVFIHNEGYSTMCGHAVISLGRYLIDHGMVTRTNTPETRILMQCPCGPVETFVEYKDGKTGNVRFNSVPVYLFKKDITVSVADIGDVTVDIMYGGAFYGFISAGKLGCRLGETPVEDIRSAARKLKASLAKTVDITHPESPDLAFLYGIMVTDDDDDNSSPGSTHSHVCVYANNEIDRSPCGSGTTARVAHQFCKGSLKIGDSRFYQGPTGSKFKATLVKQVKYCQYDAVVVEVAGKGHYSGSCTFMLEADDGIGKGFLLQ